jgi:hypothetical protein
MNFGIGNDKRMSYREQKIVTLPEHLLLNSVFGGVLVDVSEVFSYFFKNPCGVLEGHVLLFYF